MDLLDEGAAFDASFTRPNGINSSPPSARLRATFLITTGAVAMPRRCSASGFKTTEARSFSVMTLAGGPEEDGFVSVLPGLQPTTATASAVATRVRTNAFIRLRYSFGNRSQ